MSSERQSAADLLRDGMAHHRSGRPAEAAKCCVRALSIAPDNADGLHLLAVALHRMGKRGKARGLFERAIALAPDAAAYRNNFGNLLRDEGEAPSAQQAYEKAIGIDPDYAQAWGNLAVIQLERGDWDTAESSARRALTLHPHMPEAAVALARIRMNKGAPNEAGGMLHECVAHHPQFGPARHHYANFLIETKQFDGAVAQAEAAVGYMPGSAKAHSTLGTALMSIGETGAAVLWHAKAYALDPNDPHVAYNCANALQHVDRHAEAAPIYRRALRLKPDYADALSNLGNALHRIGRADEAEQSFRRAIALRPGLAMSHFNLAVMLLCEGRYREGFDAYEWRWEIPARMQAKRPFTQPMWDGSRMEGKTLTLHCEQGYGDCIMFARFVARAKQAFGGAVIVEAYQPLRRLFATLPGADRVVAQNAEPPECDAHLPLMSLPRILGIDLDGVGANAPYLSAPKIPNPLIAARADGGLRVGFVWSGNPGQRNNAARAIAVDDLLAAVADLPLALFSLQVGDAARDLKDARMIDLSATLDDFSDTAAAIEQLDLVVTVDTAVAHLAGALGKSSWVLLHDFPAWQWILRPDRAGVASSPWHPSLKIMRKGHCEDWRGVLTRMRADLIEIAERPRGRVG